MSNTIYLLNFDTFMHHVIWQAKYGYGYLDFGIWIKPAELHRLQEFANDIFLEIT